MFGIEFIGADRNISDALVANYELSMVMLSYVIASIGAFAGLNVVPAIKSSQSLNAKLAWGLTGSVAMGIAVWSMHFTGMLAYTLPVHVGMELLHPL